MRKSLGRRFALKKPKWKKIEKLEAELEELVNVYDASPTEDSDLHDRIEELTQQISALKNSHAAVPFFDPLDLQYRNYVQEPSPNHQAVMFCIMDVSGSMTQHHKELAKKFYMLLYFFLSSKYDAVDVVFIRHHSSAMESTEQEFFYGRETGGTIVSTGFEMMKEIQTQRYPASDWNIYVAQASDGDNWQSDNAAVVDIMEDYVLQVAQYMAYVEVGDRTEWAWGFGQQPAGQTSDLWEVYKAFSKSTKHFNMRKIGTQEQILPVFRDLFSGEDDE